MSPQAWLEIVRQKAWETYHDSPDPSRAQHLWRYTDPAAFRLPDQIVDTERRKGLIEVEGEAPAGVEVLDLAEAAADRPELVRDRLGTLVTPADGQMAALNLARFQNGLVVCAPEGAAPSAPVSLVCRPGRARYNSSRLLVVAGEGADLSLVVSFSSNGEHREPHLHNVTEVFAAPGSRIRLAFVQDLGETARLHLIQRTRADREAKSETVMASLGGAVVKADIGTVLAGEGADSESWGIVVGDGAQHFDHHTVHEHKARHTHSNFNYKTVLKGHARSIYTGAIRIEKDAPDCEAYQENRNLMLEETARADSIPELEIMNNDVACTHGATMGPIEPEYLFYLESRGIPKDDAVRLFVDGFVSPALSRMPPAVEAALRDRLTARMERL